MPEYSVDEDRRFVANLLRNVLFGSMSVRQAMLNYPKDTQDKSLIAAYHALIHYDADEELRLRDPLYKEEQDNYIAFLYQTLEQGIDLPKNVIDNYDLYYSNAPVLHEDNASGFLKSFFKYLNIGNK